MKKIAIVFLFVALTSPAFADGFASREADRSGLTGTAAAIGNTIGGVFSQIGDFFRRAANK